MINFSLPNYEPPRHTLLWMPKVAKAFLLHFQCNRGIVKTSAADKCYNYAVFGYLKSHIRDFQGQALERFRGLRGEPDPPELLVLLVTKAHKIN